MTKEPIETNISDEINKTGYGYDWRIPVVGEKEGVNGVVIGVVKTF